MKQSREWLSVSADVLGVLAYMAVAIPAGAVIFLGAPVYVLIGACLASLALNAYLAFRTRALRRDRRALVDSYERDLALTTSALAMVRQTTDQINRIAARVGTDQPTARPKLPPSAWLPDPKDLTSLSLAASDFEACYERSLAIARPLVGDDAEPRLEAVLLLHSATDQATAPTPWIEFSVVSPSSMKRAAIRFLGSPAASESSTYPMTSRQLDAERLIALEAPWRKDVSWTVLVRSSWRRVRPFTGAVVMTALPPRLSGDKCVWRVAYASSGAPVQLFTLRRDELAVI